MEVMKELDEVSVAAGVAAPPSKYAFGKIKDRVAKQGGMEIVKQINEDIDYNVKKDYDAFVAANVKTKTDLETKLSKSLVGKNVVVRGKKNVKTGIYIKNYEIEVQSVNIDGTDIVLVDKKNDKYFVDKNYTIKIIDPTKQTPAQQPPTQSTSGQPDLSKEISK
mgnify:CR=1 FL=1